MPSREFSHRQLFHLLHRRCKSLRYLKAIHAQATVHGLTSLYVSPVFAKLLYRLTLLLPTAIDRSASLPAAANAAAEYALSLFHAIPFPSAFPYNLLMRVHTLLSSPLSALLLFACMRRSAVPPDSHTFPFALKACTRLHHPALARALHCQALVFGFADDLYVHNTLISTYSSCYSMPEARTIFDERPSVRDVTSYNILMDGYLKTGEIGHARKLFDRMPERDVISWGTLLAGYTQMDEFEAAVMLFDRMLAIGEKPDDVALVSVLSCCAQLGKLDKGEGIHEYIKNNRAKLNVYLSTALIDMYAKCGCVSVALEIFELTWWKNLFTWNAIIVGLAMHGNGKKSLEYFNRMSNVGVQPDGVTFLGILVACSHAGLVDMARSFFSKMESSYGVERELKHYGCMADLLGRAGLIKEAMEMIKGMPMKPDAYVWGSVLAGCRIHGNIEIAEIAAEHLLELDPDNSGIFSSMADIYANNRRWEDVGRIRKLMSEKGVKMKVACSSI